MSLDVLFPGLDSRFRRCLSDADPNDLVPLQALALGRVALRGCSCAAAFSRTHANSLRVRSMAVIVGVVMTMLLLGLASGFARLLPTHEAAATAAHACATAPASTRARECRAGRAPVLSRGQPQFLGKCRRELQSVPFLGG